MHIKFYSTYSFIVCQIQERTVFPLQQAGIRTNKVWATLGRQWDGAVGSMSNMAYCVMRYSPLVVGHTAYVSLFTIQSSGWN